ncbi:MULTISPECIES: YebG family protein [Raoultella]|jgi:dsDNA-binding SOS-regulon protein|uniref:DNA damage-inducible protein in SOS regulon n=1 Tax=Raoultella planticola TaxID=575 RepID=A0A443VSV1_RAOPL|nr:MULTISPECIES: YebG family protein [Raoultella]ALQ46073.1 DNA damage-inducible protein in SOS regulon, dependent on cyclic AMP and H-NS [Raoultella ornithinolytica]EKW3526055.1 YebG family protein [Raoultella planticola]EKW5591483.1 YebG family protein [Raoultella planticola]ELC3571137.1 YebG family protein [Raoultella planticola]ELF4968230.1 YebG family protein [Raoultella planticola]
MAVEIKYVVIREGEEKMSFTSKKEADAYDKMLDLAEVLNDWLVECPLTLDEIQRDEMAMWLAERKETLHHILRSGKLPEAEDGTNGQASQDESSAAETSEAAAEGASEQPAATAPVKSRKVKAA